LTETLVAAIGLILLVQATLAKGLWDIIFKVGILILFCYFGYLLIRSVLQEVKRREQLQKLTEKLESANLQLKRFDQAKSDFVDIASHQLRTPTTGFKGYMSMLLEEDFGPLNPEQRRAIQMCYDNTERMVSLIDNFLDITKIEAGKLDLNKQKVQIEDLIEEAFKILKFTAERKKLYLKFESPKEKLPELLVDPQRMRDVLFNLVDNALKYTMQGGVTVFCEKKENEMVIHVKDTGMGIPKEEQNILFGKFIRGDRAIVNPNGSGLGLFIIKKIVEQHQGKVWVESEGHGKGSTFSVSLPIK
jgi:signal transduction histidine kinase